MVLQENKRSEPSRRDRERPPRVSKPRMPPRRGNIGRMLSVIDHLYGSILDDAEFPVALETMVHFIGAKGAYWIMTNPATGEFIRTLGVGMDPIIERQYNEYYGARDLRLKPALEVPIGEAFTEVSLVDAETYRSSEVFGELLQPHDVPHMMGMWAAKSPTVLGALTLQRGQRQGSFNRDDLNRLTLIAPHIVRALQIRGLVEPLRQRRQVYLSILDHMPFGTLYLDERGKILDASVPAQDLLRESDGLNVRYGRLAAQFSADDAALQRAIRSASRSSNGNAVTGRAIQVQRRKSSRPLTLSIVPLRSPHLFMSMPPACLVLIHDPDATTTLSVATIQQALDLSRAEAELACVLFKGVSLKEAAQQLDVSVNTCKTQLKSIYAKTGCRSHVDLARTVVVAGIVAAT